MCQKLSQTNTRVFFFIDGLDEYEGRSGDIVELREILRGLPNLRLCISSRPWNEFEHSFGRDRPQKLFIKLRNHGDIEKYVYETLKSDESTWAFSTESSESAKLSFREGLINGDRIQDLRERLRTLPTDLNVYFEKILLADVDPFYRSQASRMLQVAVAVHDRLPLAAFWFIGTGCDEPGFDPDIQPMTLEQMETCHQQLAKILNARCRGLLEVHDSRFSQIRRSLIPEMPSVDFCHHRQRLFDHAGDAGDP
ncbi:hypothetical protein V8F33_011473, partial [Rhypophila sp. PSN 637]